MYGFYRAFPISSRFLAKIANVTHLRINLRTCVVPKNRTVLAAIVELSGWIRRVILAKGGHRLGRVCTKNYNCMLEDLPETDRRINILAARF